MLHTQPKQTAPDTGKDKDPKKDALPKVSEEPDAIKNQESMWLYATKDYVDLNTLYVEKITLTIGGQTYTLEDQKPTNIGEGFQYADKQNNYLLKLGTIRDSQSGSFNYRSIALQDRNGASPDAQWTIELLVERQDTQTNSGEFKLTFKRANTVTLMSGSTATEPGKVLKTLRLPQGGSWADIPADQEALNTELAAEIAETPQVGQRWVWKLPEAGSVTGNMTIYRSSEAIRYQVAFDGGYDGWELDGYEMTPLQLKYDETAKAPACGFDREGYTFKGWATSQDGQVVYSEGALLTNLTDKHGDTVTLYAVWEKKDVPDQSDDSSSSDSTVDTPAAQPKDTDAASGSNEE